MEANTLKPPFRMVCQQANRLPTYFLGGEFQHRNRNETASVYLNTTKVTDPEHPTASIAPYERWTFNDSPLTCQTHFCSGSIPCSPWERPFLENSFTASLDASGSQVTESFYTCKKSGFKTVQARKAPQGYWGFNNAEAYNAPTTVDGCGDGTTVVQYRNFVTQSARTRYRTIAMSSDYVHTDYDTPAWSFSEGVSVTETIDKNSGLYNFTDFSSTGGNRHAIGNIGIALQGFGAIVSGMCRYLSPLFPSITVAWDASSITLTVTNFDGSTYILEQESYDILGGTFSRDINMQDSSKTVFNVFHEEYSVSETSLHYYSISSFYDSGFPSSTLAQTDEITVNATLSDAYTNTDVYNDGVDLLAHWDMTNDTQYPWRQDSKPQIAVLVARDEQINQNFTTNFSVPDYGNPQPSAPAVPTTMPDPFWNGNCGLTVAQDPSTGTTTVAIDFDGINPGDVISGSVGNPFSGAVTSSANITYNVQGGSFPDGVSFDATTGVYSGTATDAGHWGVTIGVSNGIPMFTGDLVGAPLPAGHHDSFNWNFNDLKACCDRDDEGDVSWDIYQQGWGMNVSTFNSFAGTQLPLNATNWNNSIESMNKPDGAWMFYADPHNNYFPAGCVSSFGTAGGFDNSFLVLQKYAIIFDDWPSQNFARPAGADKFMYNEIIGNVYWISGSATTSSAQYIVDLVNHNIVPDGTDFSGIWGGPAVGGFYNVSVTGGVATMGTKHYDVPSDWTSASEDESECFGRLRYPGAPSVLGRQLVTSLTDSGSGTILTWAIPQTNFGLSVINSHQETIDIYDNQMNLLTGSQIVKRVDDNQFSCSLSSSVLKNGANYYVIVSGSAKWYMNDDTPKGDYVLFEWLSDYRSLGEFGRITGSVDCSGNQITLPTHNAGGGDLGNQFAYFSQSQACLPVSPCAPKVICISPNGEQFPNGHTYPFPTDFVLDATYGMQWWKWPMTMMSDLLWQQPHRKAGIGICAPWKNDNYGCNPDVITPCPGDDDFTGEEPPPVYFFAAPPQVEARVTVPCNYGNGQNECGPAVPSDVQIGYLSPVFYPFGSPSGSVAIPPPAALTTQDGVPNGVQLASAIHAAICGAMGGGCRFDYSTDGCGT